MICLTQLGTDSQINRKGKHREDKGHNSYTVSVADYQIVEFKIKVTSRRGRVLQRNRTCHQGYGFSTICSVTAEVKIKVTTHRKWLSYKFVEFTNHRCKVSQLVRGYNH
jgi:hypothetical protein